MRLTTNKMMDLTIDNERSLEKNISRSPDMRNLSNLRNACDAFSMTSYRNIQSLHNASTARGISAEYCGIKILTYCLAGRIIVTLTNSTGDFVSLVGHESDDTTDNPQNGMAGLHGIDCDIDVALDMLEVVTRYWWRLYHTQNSVVVTTFVSNENISIL